MYFEYNSSLHKSYLGNFYFNHDLTDIDEDGIADNPYNLPGDEPDDNFPLAATIENYSFNYSKSEVISFKMNHPKMYQLSQNYPNPFNPSTTINYSLPQPGFIKITIYDKLGRMVRTQVSGYQIGGEHTVVWDGRDSKGELVSSGMYFYTLQAGNDILFCNRMIMLK